MALGFEHAGTKSWSGFRGALKDFWGWSGRSAVVAP